MMMRTVLKIAVLAAMSLAPITAWAGDGVYTMPFIATPNWPTADGEMRISVANGKSTVTLKIRGAAPDSVYTIWTVFGSLGLNPDLSVPAGHAPPQCSPGGPSGGAFCTGWNGWSGFPVGGHSVAPTAKISSRFTDGMGLDPGATFVTNGHGDGQVTVTLDYDIIDNAPVGNKNVIAQSVKVCPADGSACFTKSENITTTYLRKFIADIPVNQRGTDCENYAIEFDPDKTADTHGVDARLWQCVDPATGMPRVHRFGFDHFRLANHLDGLTHGFIGGNGTDHIIDMVGMRACLSPAVAPLPAAGATPLTGYVCPVPPAATTGK